MERNNETWVRHLNGGGAEQRAALSDLRTKLLRGLRSALSTRTLADDAFLEDIVQESLLRILERLSQFEGRSRFPTWASAIAIRLAMSELRRRRWRDVSLDALAADTDSVAETAMVDGSVSETQWVRAAMIANMHDIIRNDLTEKQRLALLAELKGMPQDEIARHIGSNRNAVYKLTHDARKRLKRGLEAAGYEAADISAAFDT